MATFTGRIFDVNTISSVVAGVLTTLQSSGEHSANSREASSVQSGR